MSSRQLARELGEKYYDTGLPCKSGHLAKRATVSGACYECTAEASANWRRNNLDIMAAHLRKYRANNKDKVKENDLKTMVKRREDNPQKYKDIKNKSYRKIVLETQGREVRDFNIIPLDEVITRILQPHKKDLVYVSGFTKLQADATFKCTIHNKELVSNVHNVIRGANPCTQCNHKKSAAELAILKYLSIFTKTLHQDKSLLENKRSELDIYIPNANLAVEFHGMYWHSHFNAEDEKANKDKSYNKYKECADKGVRLITVYETEWQQRQPQIKRLLRNAIGKTKGKLMARKCQLGEVSTQEAKEFYDRYHPQGGEGNGKHYGLYWKGKLVACMRFAIGSNDRGHNTNRVWTLARFATRVNVLGGASKLFKAFVKDEQPEIIKSFSDNRYFSGGMYEQLGFTMELESKPDYQVWSQKLGLRPKSHYQRRALQKRLNDHKVNEVYEHTTDTRTEKEMTYLMGAGRIYDCGKKRWVWTP